MNTPPKFEQQLSDWLEEGPVNAPEETLENILGDFPSLPQRRAALRAPWRTSFMKNLFRGLIGIAAVVVIAAGGLLVFARLQPGNVGGQPSAIPTTSSPSATAEPSTSSTSSLSPSATAGQSTPLLSPSPDASVVSGGCPGSDLAVQVMDWQGAAGTRFATLKVQNMGTGSCLVSGTPGLQLADGHGQVFLDSANLGEPASVSPAKPVFTLRGGGADSVYLVVGLSNYCGADPVAPVRLALVLPTGLGRVVATAPAGVVITMAPCNGSSAATTLHVQMPWSTTAP